MFHIDIDDGDAPEFIDSVNFITERIATLHAPPEIIVVKIDNWFDHKWLHFSGKMLGAFGTWIDNHTIPPFVPNRVIWERCFALSANKEIKTRAALHISTTATNARQRKVSAVAPNAALLWFSGKSETNKRGSIISYIPLQDGYWDWYAGYSEKDNWASTVLKGISKAEFSDLSIAESI